MKNLIFLLTLLISGSVFSTSLDTIRAKSEITDVTAFFSGAQVTRNYKIVAARGKHLIIFDRLPSEVNPQSVQVNGIDNCKILSVKHQLVYPDESKKEKNETELESQIEKQELNIKEIKNKFSVFDLEEKLLLDNSILSKKDEGSSIADIKEAADFYRARLNEIRQGKLDLSVELKDADKKLQELYRQINELTSIEHKTYSQVLVTLDCEKDLSDDLKVSYYVPSAGWTPLYDFRVDEITEPLIIVYNANIFQTTGEDWTNVNLKLSANNPSLTGEKPELITWYLGTKNPYHKEPVKKGSCALQGRIIDSETNEALPFANVVLEQGGTIMGGTSSDFDGQYMIKPIPSGIYNVKVTYIGYKPAEINSVSLPPNVITFLDIKLEATKQQLETFEVIDYKVPLISKDETISGASFASDDVNRLAGRPSSTAAGVVGGVYPKGNEPDQSRIRGAREDAKIMYIDGIKVPEVETSNYISNSLKTNIANLEYVIEIPYTIPSDGKDYSIKMKEVSLPVEYVYHAVPKLENDVFLTAEIKEWTNLNLLSGKLNIYYQGTYTGESFIDAEQAEDTLKVSLGRDNSILVKREVNKEMFDKRMMGGNIKETLAWDITVKNNKNARIKIVVEDQFPLSQKKSIEVERLEYSNAKLDDKTGKMTWVLDLEPNDKNVLNYKYSVKYPKYLSLSMD
jgi:hypothetical protein